MCFPTRIPVTLHLVFIVSICFLVSLLFLHEFLLTFPSSESSLSLLFSTSICWGLYFRPQDVSLVSKSTVLHSDTVFLVLCVCFAPLWFSVASTKFCGLNRELHSVFLSSPLEWTDQICLHPLEICSQKWGNHGFQIRVLGWTTEGHKAHILSRWNPQMLFISQT